MAQVGKIGIGKLRSYVIGTGVAIVGSVAITCLPNTIGVKYAGGYLKRTLPYIRRLKAEPETEALLNEVIAEINATRVEPVDRNRILFLQTNRLFPFPIHKGSSTTGCFIAFPICTRCNAEEVFHYHSPDQLSLEMAKFCLLSQEAKKFLFAREIFYVEDGFTSFRCLLATGLVLLGSAVLYAVNSALTNLKDIKLEMFALENNKKKTEKLYRKFVYRAFLQRRMVFFSLVTVFVPLYVILRNYYNFELEKAADEKVASLGHEYIKGGQEYYRKVLAAGQFNNTYYYEQTNFNKNGTLNQGQYPFLFKHVPADERYAYFKSLGQEDMLQGSS